eukprot:6175942-Pleurochrysis_carterae.AAC.1
MHCRLGTRPHVPARARPSSPPPACAAPDAAKSCPAQLSRAAPPPPRSCAVLASRSARKLNQVDETARLWHELVAEQAAHFHREHLDVAAVAAGHAREPDCLVQNLGHAARRVEHDARLRGGDDRGGK